MAIRGVRGAITVDSNTKEEIIERTKELLAAIVEHNHIAVEDIASAIFSVTEDLNAEFPAVAARRLGWLYTPLFCVTEIPVPGSLKRCVRVLLHVNTDRRQEEMKHLYLRDAKKLRPDLESGDAGTFYLSDQ